MFTEVVRAHEVAEEKRWPKEKREMKMVTKITT